MAGIVYCKTGGAVQSLTGSEYTAVTPLSKTLYIQTGTGVSDKIGYGLTTDTTASIYSPVVNISGTNHYIASMSQWTETVTTGTVYETTETISEVDRTIQSTSSTTNTTSNSTANCTLIRRTTSTLSTYNYGTIINSRCSRTTTYDIRLYYPSDSTKTSIETTGIYSLVGQSYSTMSQSSTRSTEVLYTQTRYYTCTSGAYRMIKIDGASEYTSASTLFSTCEITSLITQYIPVFTFGNRRYSTKSEKITTNTSYGYEITEHGFWNNERENYQSNTTDPLASSDYYAGHIITHTSSTTYSGTYYMTRTGSSTTALSSNYGTRYTTSSQYQIIATASSSASRYKLWPAYTWTESTSKSTGLANWTSYGAWITALTVEDGVRYIYTNRYRYKEDGETAGKLAAKAKYVSGCSQYDIHRTLLRTNTTYYTTNRYSIYESCTITTAHDTVTETVTTNTIYLTDTVSHSSNNCNA